MEGIFRLNGSAKRIKELQVIFDSPDRYGKGLDWTGYTVHDAANILRRYLNQLPQPIVPLDFYERCRDPLRTHQAQAVGDIEAKAQAAGEFDHEASIRCYQKLITELPPLNRQLLLYILDLLAVFASKSEQNRMTSANLAAIFQPGLLSHPDHSMSPSEYRLSQDVLIFLIENQDSFLVGMSGTEADEKTVKEVQGGAQRPQSTPKKATQAGLGRSASNASGGADSLRRIGGGLRRNLSISSRNSRGSNNAPSPGSPAGGSPLVKNSAGGGIYRSNTVPSKRSPSLPSARFSKASGEPEITNSAKESSGNAHTGVSQPSSPGSKLTQPAEARSRAAAVSPVTGPEKSPLLSSVPESNTTSAVRDVQPNESLGLKSPELGAVTTISTGTPTRDRKSSFFSRSPTSDADRKDGRQPNKLRKRQRTQTTSNNVSAQSSTHSLPGQPEHTTDPSLQAATVTEAGEPEFNHDTPTFVAPIISNTDASPIGEQPPHLDDIDKASSFHISQHTGSRNASPAARASKSPVPSLHSRASVAEESELEHNGNGGVKDAKKRHSRWRLPSTSKSPPEEHVGSHSGPRLGSSAVAETSETSFVSMDKPKKSETFDSQQTTAATEASTVAGTHVSSNESSPSKEKDTAKETEDREKKGPIGWFKAKVAQAKEEREERRAEREAERERAKSPPPSQKEPLANQGSLNAVAQEGASARSTETADDGSPEQKASVTDAVPVVEPPKE